MKYRWRIKGREWLKALMGVGAGSALTLFFLLCFLIDTGCFVPHEKAELKRIEQVKKVYWNDVYNEISARGTEAD